MFHHKKAIAVLLGLALLPTMFYSVNLAYAKHHRIAGVDYPYDASAYYSMTAISWADSAPSKYALRDLAGNGGNVIDLTRLVKSILFGDKYQQIWSEQQKNSEAYEIKVKPYGIPILAPAKSDIEEIQELTKQKNATLEGISYVLPEDWRAKSKTLDKNYEAILDVAHQTIQSEDQNAKALQDAMALNANAQGTLQAEQARNTMNGLSVSLDQEEETLLQAVMAGQVTEYQNEMNEEIEDRNKQKFINAVNPYREKTKEALADFGYEVYESKGMPDF